MFPPASPSAKYCETCGIEARRKTQRDHYHKNTSSDPTANRRRHAQAMQRALAAGEMERVREKRRLYSQEQRDRIAASPERAERRREYDREYKRARRQALQANNPAAYEAHLAAIAAATREYQRQWKAARRAAMSDEQRAEALRRYREWKGLRDLVALQSEILRERDKK